MRYMALGILGALCALSSACVPISLSDEADDFGTSAGKFTGSLNDSETERTDAVADTERAAAEGAIAANSPIHFDEECWCVRFKPLKQRFDDALKGPYNAAAIDKAYAGLHAASPCALQPAAPLAPVVIKEMPTFAGDDITTASVSADTLEGAAKALSDYVDVLTDIVANKTGAKRDAAVGTFVDAGGALLDAVKVKNGGAVTGFVGQLVQSLMAAEQNSRFAQQLEAYDRLMPYIMERVGHAGRLTTALALDNREQAAEQYARSANRLLGMASNPVERFHVLAEAQPPLDKQNAAILRLRRVDPMIAARHFAKAHHDLVAAYVDPKTQLGPASAGLQAFRKAASDLHDALSKESGK
jgi:hypothetical protein